MGAAMIYTTTLSDCWLTDGVTRRPIPYAHRQTCIDLGLLPPGATAKWVPASFLEAIPPATQLDTVAFAEYLAPRLTTALASRVAVLPDLDIERIKDASVEANELCKGTLTGNTMRFTRVAQPV